jgi:hypothetical protein
MLENQLEETGIPILNGDLSFEFPFPFGSWLGIGFTMIFRFL